MTPRRILAATDFSATADLALDMAVAMAKDLGAELIPVHVSAPVMVLPPPFELLSMPTLLPDLPRRIEEQLETPAAKACDAGVTCRVELRDGKPPAEIVR